MKLVIKYGGSAMGTADSAILNELGALRPNAMVLVHGGGPEIDEALSRRGIESNRIEGLRTTSAEALEVVEATLCATINKRLVRACLQRGIPAVGISGEDGGMVKCKRARSSHGQDLGFVGEVTHIDVAPLEALLAGGFLPIVAPIAIDESAAHAFNVNADTAAGAIAGALKADAYVTLTNVERVYRNPADPASGINRMTVAEAAAFAQSPACTTGMKPKLLAAIAAVNGGAKRAYICAAEPGAIGAALAGNATIIG